jgi:hypothetical protein
MSSAIFPKMWYLFSGKIGGVKPCFYNSPIQYRFLLEHRNTFTASASATICGVLTTTAPVSGNVMHDTQMNIPSS